MGRWEGISKRYWGLRGVSGILKESIFWKLVVESVFRREGWLVLLSVIGSFE